MHTIHSNASLESLSIDALRSVSPNFALCGMAVPPFWLHSLSFHWAPSSLEILLFVGPFDCLCVCLVDDVSEGFWSSTFRLPSSPPDSFRLRVFPAPQSAIGFRLLPFLHRLLGASVRFNLWVRQYRSTSHSRVPPLCLALPLWRPSVSVCAACTEPCFWRRPLRRVHRFWRSSAADPPLSPEPSVSPPLRPTLLLSAGPSSAGLGALALSSTVSVIRAMNSRSIFEPSAPFGASRFVSWMDTSCGDQPPRRRTPPTICSSPSPAIWKVPWSVISTPRSAWHRTRPWRSARSVLSYGIRLSVRFSSGLVVHPRKRPLARTSPPYCKSS